jgi:hypothetical protein
VLLVETQQFSLDHMLRADEHEACRRNSRRRPCFLAWKAPGG